MALPKGKVSKARGRKRRANWKLSLPGIVECPQCHEKKLSHRVCKHCGHDREEGECVSISSMAARLPDSSGGLAPSSP